MAQFPQGEPVCFDIAIVGAGLAGSLAAIVLGRKGYRVALIDRHAEIPHQFRVEKLAGEQTEKLRRLGCLDVLEAAGTAFGEFTNVYRGRIIGRTRQVNHSFYYEELGNALRAALPASVEFIVGRVDDISTSADVQSISVAGRDAVTARLVVLATGMGDVMRRKLGIERRVIHEKQSLTFGFNIVPAGAAPLRFRTLNYNGDRPAEGIDYLNLFPIRDETRVNLFTFLALNDPRVEELRNNPKQMLARALPGLVPVLGDFEVRGKVEAWPMDLSVAENVVQDGIVLIGDAYQTSCPAAGTGVSRILTDVERLCTVHVPAWLDGPDMAAEKIAQFYADPEKLAMDHHALKLAHYRRSFTIARGLSWELRRRLSFGKRRLKGLLDGTSPAYAFALKGLATRRV